MDIQNAFAELTEFITSQNEFLLINSAGKSFALKKDEIELEFERGRILLSFLDDKGFQTWRISSLKKEKSEIILNLTRNFEKENEKFRIVQRISAEELGAEVELARIEKANEIAKIIISENQNSKLIRVSLNKENGRFAQLIIEKDKKQIAVLTDVSETVTPEIYISNAILWLARLENRKKNPIFEIWLVANKKISKNLQSLHALLSENWKRKIKVFELSKKDGEEKILQKKSLEIEDLWREKPLKLKLAESLSLSRTAKEIIKFAPEKIDHIFTKHGETLRFFGLPFARVRKVFDAEKCWFGIERGQRILSDKTFEDFEKLIENLEIYRSFDSDYKRHALFRLSPEAWLEAILRRNIKLLDANLILSPIYNQFRASNDKIDLLALRRDGRIVIIELKVSPDREMIFQAADYWRKIELQRRKGILQKAKIFGDLEISDKPTIIYLVAPTLSFHRDFRFLAKTISSEIEIYRFDLAENWREDLKVLRREKTGTRTLVRQ
jgi:hypothetical protein